MKLVSTGREVVLVSATGDDVVVADKVTTALTTTTPTGLSLTPHEWGALRDLGDKDFVTWWGYDYPARVAVRVGG